MMQHNGPAYRVKLISRMIPIITPVVIRYAREPSSFGTRVIAQTRTTMLIEASGNQKSRLRIGVDGCSQNNAKILLTRITHLCQRAGVIQTSRIVIPLITRMFSKFILEV